MDEGLWFRLPFTLLPNGYIVDMISLDFQERLVHEFLHLYVTMGVRDTNTIISDLNDALPEIEGNYDALHVVESSVINFISILDGSISDLITYIYQEKADADTQEVIATIYPQMARNLYYIRPVRLFPGTSVLLKGLSDNDKWVLLDRVTHALVPWQRGVRGTQQYGAGRSPFDRLFIQFVKLLGLRKLLPNEKEIYRGLVYTIQYESPLFLASFNANPEVVFEGGTVFPVMLTYE